LAEPYVLVNYYNGGHYADHAGRGGISWLTGTANWLAMLLFDYIIPATVEWEPDEAERDG
jgi:cellobiose phosphorylase